MNSERKEKLEELEKGIQRLERRLNKKIEENLKRAKAKYQYTLGCAFCVPIIVIISFLYAYI